MRVLRVIAPTLVAALFAVAGTVLNYFYVLHNLQGHLSRSLQLVVGVHLQPFPGRILGRGTSAHDVLTWLVGLAVLVVVLAAFLALGGTSGRVSAFLAGWLGTVVGTAVGGLVGGTIYLSRIYPSGSGGTYPELRTQFVLSSFNGSLYWAFFVGIVIGLVALVFGARPAPAVTAAAVPAALPPPPAAP